MKKQNQNEQTNQPPPPQKYPTKTKQKNPMARILSVDIQITGYFW